MIDSLDSVIEALPIGIFHYRMLIMCGLAFMGDSLEVNLLSFLSTCAGDDFHLSDLARASITGMVFFGQLVGGLFWGPLADRYGRKKAFLLASTLIVTGGFLSGASPSYGWLIFFRTIVGFGVGGLTVPFDLLAEFLPLSRRGTYLIYIEYFWTIGSIFMVGMAWATLDTFGWRGLTYITAIPVTLSCIASWIYLPESPRWLMIKGRHDEAETVVKQAAVTSGYHLSNFSLREDSSQANSAEYEVADNATFMDLVGTEYMRGISFPLWIIWSSFGFSYYGIILFVSRLYTSPTPTSGSCSFDYESIFINASAEVLGVTFAAMYVDSWGRTKTQALFYLVAGISVILMGLKLPSEPMLPYVSMVARLCAMASSSSTWVATSELYPTEFRTTGHSLCSSLARAGAFLVPYFVISSIDIAVVGAVLGAVNFVAAATAYWLLPETKGPSQPPFVTPFIMINLILLLFLLFFSSSSPSQGLKLDASTNLPGTQFTTCPSQPSISTNDVIWTENALVDRSI